MRSALTLAAREPLPVGWLNWIENTASKSGLAHVRNRGGVFVLGDRSSARGLAYTDGVALSRLWLGPRRWALGALPKRVYFESGSDRIDRRPERDIVGSKRPPRPRPEDQIQQSEDILGELTSAEPMESVPVDAVFDERPGSLNVWIKDHSAPVTGTFNGLYRSHGFDSDGSRWLISVCPVEGTPESVAVTFCRKLESVAAQRSTNLKIQIVDLELIKSALTANCQNRERRNGKTILFLLPRKGQAPSDTTLDVLRDLDRGEITYRRAYADDPFDFSIPDQLPSLLMASGGRPHRVEVRRLGDPVWSVGIDLSHRPDEATSTLATTLVDPTGALVGTWLMRQKRNEKPNAESQVEMMRRSSERINALGGSSDPVLIMRDGRMFEGESFEQYDMAFDGPTTVIEYRKGQNPPVLEGCHSAPAPGAYLIRDESTMFIATMEPRSPMDLPSFAKVTWRGSWNQAMFSPRAIAESLIGLSLAPGLGMHRREKPAPIYWADGVAGVTLNDLRFAGNAPVRLD